MVMVLVLGLLIAACGSGAEDGPAGEGPPTDGETADADSGEGSSADGIQWDETLRIGMGSDVATLDPLNRSTINDTVRTDFIFNKIVDYDTEFNILPDLALSWEQIDDLTWEFELREGVVFHDGTPFEAEAVRINVERALNGPRPHQYPGPVKEVEVLDPHRVRFHMERPMSSLLQALASGPMSIVSPAALEEFESTDEFKPIGTGPYTLERWESGNLVVLERFEDYWGDDFLVGRIEFQVVPESGTRFSALQSGELDAIENPPPEQLGAIQSDPGLQVVQRPNARTVWFGFNSQNPVVEDRRIRMAVAHAIDRDAIVSGVLEGSGTPAHNGMFDPVVHFPEPPIGFEYDPDASRALLEEAVGGELSLQFTIPQARYLKDREVATVLQAQLAEVGIDLQLDVLETGAWYDKVMAHETEAFLLGWGQQSGDVAGTFIPFMTGEGFNAANFSDAEFDASIDQLFALPMDSEERNQLIWEMQHTLVEDEVLIVPIYFMVSFWATTSDVQEFSTRGDKLSLNRTHFSR